MIDDFHQMNALHMGCSRQAAKQRVFAFLYSISNWSEVTLLNLIHPDTRAKLLAAKGIILGEN